MKMKKILLAAVSIAAFAQAAQAAVFTLTGKGATFTFSIADGRVPDVSYADNKFTIYDVSAPSASGLADITFSDPAFNPPRSGDLHIEDYNSGSKVLYDLYGPILYSGDESAPAFLFGNYQLTDKRGTNTYALTIAADAASPVPEPVSWIMMVGGFALVGRSLRRHSPARLGYRID